MENDERELLTIPELAKEWRVNRATVYRLVQEGAFPDAFPASGQRGWRIPRDNVNDYEKRKGCM